MLDKAHQDLEEETMKWKKISTELPSTYGEVKQEPPERRCQHGLFRELLHSQFLSYQVVTKRKIYIMKINPLCTPVRINYGSAQV
jgi:hypothetical protein